MNNVAHAFAFVAAQLLALPGLALAMYFYTVGRVARSSGFLQACFELLFSGVVVVPFVSLCFVALLVAGMFTAVRPWAAAVLLALNLSAVVIAWVIQRPDDIGEWLVWLPALLSMGLASWLATRPLAY